MSSSKRVGVYFNEGQDVLFTHEIKYHREVIEDDIVVLWVTFQSLDKSKTYWVQFNKVTYITEEL